MEFHHRDALATLKRLEAEEAERTQLKREAEVDHLNALLQDPPALRRQIFELLPPHFQLVEVVLPRSISSPLLETMRGQMERKLQAAIRNEQTAQAWLVEAQRTSEERTQRSLQPADLLDHVGFQMSAQRQDGKLKIVYLDIDSSLTSAQLAILRKDPKWATEDEDFNLVATWNQAMASAHAAIAPELRGYRTIRVKNLRELQAAGLNLQAPPGLRLEELP